MGRSQKLLTLPAYSKQKMNFYVYPSNEKINLLKCLLERKLILSLKEKSDIQKSHIFSFPPHFRRFNCNIF